MDLQFGISAYARERGNIAELPVVNMLAEEAPSEGRVILQSRAGLQQAAQVGDGPIRGLYRKDGVIGGARFAVSGEVLYSDAIALGDISGEGPVSFAGNEERVLIAAGGDLNRTDGTTVADDGFPDGNVTKVLELAGYFVGLSEGTGRYYWRLDTVPTWDALDYATAENEPDRLLDGLTVDDGLVLFGTETVEFHRKTGDSELPFLVTQGRMFTKGIRATGCAVQFDNSFAYVSKDNLVYYGSQVPQRISNSGIEERIERSVSCAVFSFFWEGHELLAVRLDQGTWLFDAQTKQWCEWASYGRDNWACQCALPGPLFGDDATGTLWEFGSGYLDDDGPLERRFRAGVALDRPAFVHNLRLLGNAGQTSFLTGDYAEPVIECRSSDDAGQTWSIWEESALGAQGQYATRVEWRHQGMFAEPGMLFEFRVTDPVPFRVSRVLANAERGGR